MAGWLGLLPQDGLDLLLHEGPGHGGALQWAPLPARTKRLQQMYRRDRSVLVYEKMKTDLVALFDNRISAAGKAELVAEVTRALYKVGVLQFA